MDSIDILRAAKILLRKYGFFAEQRAWDRATDLLAEHDTKGYAVWRQIAAAVRELERTERREGKGRGCTNPDGEFRPFVAAMQR